MSSKVFVILSLIAICILPSYSQEEDIEDKPQRQPLVIEPEVAEEIRQEMKHERELKEEEIKPRDPVSPKIEVLYKPKNCKRKSGNHDLMVVHYTGWLARSGRKFDTTVDVRRRYAPFEFVLGTGYVIHGWDLGLLDMCPGEKRKLIVPPKIAYGKKGLRGVIPPNATLIFVVDLLDLRRATPSYAPMDLFTSLDRDGDNVLSRDEVSHYVKYQARVYGHKNATKTTKEDHEKMVDEIMEKEDRNKDGIIQHSEFSGPKLQGHHGGEL